MPGTFDLPEGYRLDFLGDPDAPALRRPDGAVVARFAARGLRRQAVKREALEDQLGRGTSTPESAWPRSVRQRPCPPSKNAVNTKFGLPYSPGPEGLPYEGP
jgi:hypothetical protein